MKQIDMIVTIHANITNRLQYYNTIFWKRIICILYIDIVF